MASMAHLVCLAEGGEPGIVMTEAAEWIKGVDDRVKPILVAFPLSFDWSWLYSYS